MTQPYDPAAGPVPVPVTVHGVSAEVAASLGAPPARRKPVYGTVYTTVVLTADDPVQNILPQDPDRVIAHVMALDGDIVIGPRNVVQAPANTVTNVPTPMGTLVPSKTTAGATVLYPVLDNAAVFAATTDTSSPSRVAVSAVYRH